MPCGGRSVITLNLPHHQITLELPKQRRDNLLIASRVSTQRVTPPSSSKAMQIDVDRARASGSHRVRVGYHDARGSISSDVTAALKWLTIRCGDKVQPRPLVMPAG